MLIVGYTLERLDIQTGAGRSDRETEIWLYFIYLCSIKNFIGRETILMQLQGCVKSSNRRLVVLHGQPGSGKSAMTAKVSAVASHWIAG